MTLRKKYFGNTYLLLRSRNGCRNNYQHRRQVTTPPSMEGVKPFKSIPGLSSIPYIGPLHHFLPVIGDIGPGGFFNKFGDLHVKYGPVVQMASLFEKKHFVILFEPEHFEQVYRAEETNPLRPGFETLTYYREELKRSTFQGVYGLTTAQGPKWREFRTKVNPALMKPKIIKLYTPALEEIADEMVARIQELKDPKELLQNSLDEEMTKWSLESVALIGLGARLGCIQDGLSEDHPARKLIKSAKDILDLTFKLQIKPSPWMYISTPTFKKIVKAFDTQWDISSIYVSEAMNKINSRGHDIPEEDKSIIEKLLAIDEKVAVMMVNEMLLAGIDTVAFTMMNVLYHLAANQSAQEKLRQEINSGNTNRYLRACLKEATRIYHVVPCNVRRTSKEHVVGGYHIPKGVDVLAPNQYLSNQDKYYPRAKEFLPERWLADKTDPLYYGNTHPMVSLPFGFGIRSCIGRRIAELEMEILIKKIISSFKVTWEGPPAKVKITFVNAMEKPFRIQFESIN